MFVICWYGNSAISNIVKQSYTKNELWYKYVFIDGDNLTVQDNDMQKTLITRSTYSRWKNYGTLYGITRYSFVCLSDTSDFNKNVILNHMKTIYFQMITLLLANRASILRFSDEITAISDIDPSNKNLTQKISSLYKNYLRYKNKLYFKEITPQEQGIELYDKAREIMRVDSDIRDLSEEIGSLNSYAYLLEEKDEKEQMNKLTKLGTIFLPGTFIAGIFGMNIFPEDFLDNIGGWIVSFGSMVALTWWLSKVHDINIIEFFSKDKNE
jgi:Mg2+ and Co2+ transporter CorA